MLEQKFAEFSRIQRVKHRLSQKELAEKAGVSLKSISTIENEKAVRDVTLEKVAAFFGYEIRIKRDIDIMPIGGGVSENEK